MSKTTTCPECGAALPPNAPGGLCPKCLMQAGLASSHVDADPAEMANVPGSDDAPRISPGGETIPGGKSDQLPLGTRIRYFGDYELLEEIARGGMGVVYKARQVSLNRIVAIKMILAGQLASQDDVRRFHTEAEAAANLKHPNIVAIHEVGEHEGQHYFSMDYIAGYSLESLIQEKPIPPREAAGYIRVIAETVQYAHEQGTLHRDLKPSNILVDEQGALHVTDFGLAKRLEADSSLTATGQVLGTPSYIAPEQAAGEIGPVGPAADVYALGATLYCLLTGRPPFQAANLLETIRQVMETEPASPRQLNPEVPRDLETVCLKCLQKVPARRYRSAGALAEELERFLNGEPIYARPVGPPERLWRWCRRNPAVASLTVAAMLLFITGMAVSTFFAVQSGHRAEQAEAERRRADQRANEARDARRRADEKMNEAQVERDRAQLEKRRALRNFYAAQMSLAQRDWEQRNITNLLKRLEQTGPQATGGEDLRGFEWHYWHRLCHTELISLRQVNVRKVAFHPDGHHILAGGGRNVTVWNAETGRPIFTTRWPSGSVRSVAFSPGGRRIVAGGSNGPPTADGTGTIKMWDLQTREELLALSGRTNQVLSVAVSPDGRSIASGSTINSLNSVTSPQEAFEGAELKVWDAETGQEILTLAQPNAVHCVAFSPDNRWIVSGVGDAVRIYDAETGKKAWTLEGHRTNIYSVAVSADSRRLVSGSKDNTLKVWDLETGKELLSLKGHRGDVTSVAFSPDGRRIASGSHDKTVRVWDLESGHESLRRTGHEDGIYSVAFSPDGRQIVSASGNTIKVWEADMPQEARALKGHDRWIKCVAFSPDGRRIVSGSSDETARIWDAETGEELLTLEGHTSAVYSVAFSPDGHRIVSGAFDRTVRVWNAETGEDVLTLHGHTDRVYSASFSPDGRRIASASAGDEGGDEEVKIWDAETGQEILTLDGGRCVTFSPDGGLIASGAATSRFRLKIWNAMTGEDIRTLPALVFSHQGAAFSSDGLRIASTGTTGEPTTIKVWNTATGEEMRTLQGFGDMVNSVAFSPDGRRIVGGGKDATVKVWDAESGHELLTLKGHTGPVNSVAFSPGGRRLISAGNDNTIRIWDAGRMPEHAR